MEGNELLESADLRVIITAIIIGTFARIITLKEDFRQYPSYPNGYLIHLITGFIASALGAVALPALLVKNFIAVTFLTIAIQQFRDVRKMEKESLTDLEETEFTFRGKAYIDGIAKTFEARNYFSLVVALVTSITIKLVPIKGWIGISIGAAVGLIILFLLVRISKGKTIGDIAEVKEGTIEVIGSELYVDGMFVSNQLGSDEAQKMFKDEGMAIVIYPNKDIFRINLDNFGQRQAALFEATRSLGLKRYQFTRRDFENGRVVIALVPIKKDIDAFIEVVKKCPLLESVKKTKSVMKTKLKGW
ncbi:YIEGIA family protein [Metabacillus sediminilitoris]|uniref:YIEGIA protein n=1 Tax=Metabacillus sediminilitoris TaxID=2567941 RepID=A0A4S4BPF5_9BACI|nr:YIEGIA family protein [Metabacillus sediminilitoris]QGQ47684.1 YIEGIA protein [Metabacillus sediminilitoris]THF76790.1 YIEGIA protein [Metabacillus sediminilitoris]